MRYLLASLTTRNSAFSHQFEVTYNCQCLVCARESECLRFSEHSMELCVVIVISLSDLYFCFAYLWSLDVAGLPAEYHRCRRVLPDRIIDLWADFLKYN